MNRSILAVGLAVSGSLLLLSGCGQKEPPPPPVAPPAAVDFGPPPPTIAAQHEMALTDLGAKLTDGGLLVVLPDAAFASGSAEFKPQDSDRLDHVAGLVKQRSNLHVVVEGFADSKGSAKAKKELAQRRAEAVKQALVSRSHLDADRIEASDAGKESKGEDYEAILRVVDDTGHYVSRVGLGPGGKGASQ